MRWIFLPHRYHHTIGIAHEFPRRIVCSIVLFKSNGVSVATYGQELRCFRRFFFVVFPVGASEIPDGARGFRNHQRKFQVYLREYAAAGKPEWFSIMYTHGKGRVRGRY